MAVRDRTIRYGDPEVLSDERLLVRPVKYDYGNEHYSGGPYVLLRDEESGEEFKLSKTKANELANALKAAARSIP